MATRKKKTTVTTAPSTMDLAAQTATLLIIKPPTRQEVLQALKEAQAAVAELHAEAAALIITDHSTFLKMDALLGRVMTGERVVENKFQPIITPLREPLDQFYEWRREVVRPLEATKQLIKTKIGVYQLEEKRRLDLVAAENRKREEEIREQWLLANPPLGLPPQSNNLGVQSGSDNPYAFPSWPTQATTAVEVTYLPPPAVSSPTGDHSSTRFEKRFRTTNLDLLVDSALAGIAPLDILTIRPSKLEEYFQSDPEGFSKWPGIEIYDHPVTTGRR